MHFCCRKAKTAVLLQKPWFTAFLLRMSRKTQHMRFEDKILRKIANEDKPQVVTAWMYLTSSEGGLAMYLSCFWKTNQMLLGLRCYAYNRDCCWFSSAVCTNISWKFKTTDSNGRMPAWKSLKNHSIVTSRSGTLEQRSVVGVGGLKTAVNNLIRIVWQKPQTFILENPQSGRRQILYDF